MSKEKGNVGFALALIIAVLHLFGATVSLADDKKEDWKRSAELLTTYNQKLNSEYQFKENQSEAVGVWKQWKKDFSEFRNFPSANFLSS